MDRFFTEMFRSAAAIFGGCFAAYMTSVLMVSAGIALAVSAVFFAGTAFVRLCFVNILAVLILRTVHSSPACLPMR